ncbi:MAG: family 16 glycoside hydrolase [Verrucomicrobiota bacterium]
MLRSVSIVAVFSIAIASYAAHLNFDFSKAPLDQTPPGFRALLAGTGKPGEWKILLDEATRDASSNQPQNIQRPVLAQLSQDPTDERFPMLLYDEESFGDFTLKTKFKLVSGAVEQMAGIAFRVQDENNYYYVRASALGNTFRFFKIVNGQRSAPIGPEIQIARNVWHELILECEGNQIRCLLNGKEVLPTLRDNSFAAGKLGFWTKSDSVAYFADTKIDYTPREILAKVLVREAMQKYPRLIGLRISAGAQRATGPKVVASADDSEIGMAAENTEISVMKEGSIYTGKGQQTYTVTLPLRDRNGESVAAVRVILKSFPGQTEPNAIARALPIAKGMEARIRSADDLLQ